MDPEWTKDKCEQSNEAGGWLEIARSEGITSWKIENLDVGCDAYLRGTQATKVVEPQTTLHSTLPDQRLRPAASLLTRD
jgi:hypothetical protein